MLSFGVFITLMRNENSGNLPLVSSTEECVEFSKRLLVALESKATIHNESGINKVTTEKLKEVYLEAAASSSVIDKNVKGLIYVNSYLSLLNHDDAGDKFSDLMSLEFEEEEYNDSKKASFRIDKEFESFSEDQITTEETLQAASEDLEKYDLKKTFESVDELFIYTQNKPLGFNWEIR